MWQGRGRAEGGAEGARGRGASREGRQEDERGGARRSGPGRGARPLRPPDSAGREEETGPGRSGAQRRALYYVLHRSSGQSGRLLSDSLSLLLGLAVVGGSPFAPPAFAASSSASRPPPRPGPPRRPPPQPPPLLGPSGRVPFAPFFRRPTPPPPPRPPPPPSSSPPPSGVRMLLDVCVAQYRLHALAVAWVSDLLRKRRDAF